MFISVVFDIKYEPTFKKNLNGQTEKMLAKKPISKRLKCSIIEKPFSTFLFNDIKKILLKKKSRKCVFKKLNTSQKQGGGGDWLFPQKNPEENTPKDNCFRNGCKICNWSVLEIKEMSLISRRGILNAFNPPELKMIVACISLHLKQQDFCWFFSWHPPSQYQLYSVHLLKSSSASLYSLFSWF